MFPENNANHEENELIKTLCRIIENNIKTTLNIIRGLEAQPLGLGDYKESRVALEELSKKIGKCSNIETIPNSHERLLHVVKIIVKVNNITDEIKQRFVKSFDIINKYSEIKLPYDPSIASNITVELIRQYKNTINAFEDIYTLSRMHELSAELNVNLRSLTQYVFTLIKTTNFIQNEIKAIPKVKEFIKNRYKINFDTFINARIIKVEQLPWDLEFHIPETALLLVEIGRHTKTRIKEKINNVNKITTNNPELTVDTDESFIAGQTLRYPEVLWLHIDSRNFKIDKTIPIPTENRENEGNLKNMKQSINKNPNLYSKSRKRR